MKKLVIGILAHVDAGKTTLSEAMLYLCGNLREMGRVDKGNTFLDTHALERSRGITIFSKQALMSFRDIEITLMDTPGHVDFSAEMERTLQVLDYAVLVINGSDGVQAHTRTLWRLLARYKIPVFLFVNKMDQQGTDKSFLLPELKRTLSGSCIDFSQEKDTAFYEEIAVCEEEALNLFLKQGNIKDSKTASLISHRKLFPCFFGSALKGMGIETFMQGLLQYTESKIWPEEFSAVVYKIARDTQGNRQSFLKITGGSLKVREQPGGLDEKVNQIRIYSGEKYSTVNEMEAGGICAVTGLLKTRAGMVIGSSKTPALKMLAPVLTYRILWPEETDVQSMLAMLFQLEEEEPELQIEWNEELKEIQAKLMGEVQLEILTELVRERFGLRISFGPGNIVYKETIRSTAEGVGHFEPLKHYAEVHLLLEPGEPDSGLIFDTVLSEDELDKSWQKLILTHLKEKEHAGVLTGAPVTDMKITLCAGRAHKKHTEGGDFRQATYRAVRQGLKKADAVLLEPFYEYRLELPEDAIGRAMTDLEMLHGTFELPAHENGMSVLSGIVPVSTMQNYQKELNTYTRGQGKLFLSFSGYRPCHNEEEVIAKSDYDSERDLNNPTGSVFCAHGAGFAVSWDQVENYMHLENRLLKKTPEGVISSREYVSEKVSEFIDPEEIDAILRRTSFANSADKQTSYRKEGASRDIIAASFKERKQKKPERYLLVDGYNIIFAWEELKELSKASIDGARGRLLDMLCNYQGITKVNLIVVFDAYRVENHKAELFDYHNIHVVYTAQAETADRYIERFAHENCDQYQITVATSDHLEQIITRGKGCVLLSAKDLETEVKNEGDRIYREYADAQPGGRSYLFDGITEERVKQMKEDQNAPN